MSRAMGNTRSVGSLSSSSVTTTVTLENLDPSPSSSSPQPPQTLVLRLNPRKKVTWKEGTVDNEFLQKKSSKKCCIFHKQKPFDEDDSDDDPDPDPNSKKPPHDHNGCCSKDGGTSHCTSD